VMVENIRSQFDITIFVHRNASLTDLENFIEELSYFKEIEKIDYISTDSAAAQFKAEFGEDIFSILDYNPLPPSFTLRLKPQARNLASIEDLTTRIKQYPIVDEVRYRENFLRLLEKYQRLIFIAVVTAFIGLTLISIILASNSIKMTIFSRRNVIATMKLVGATNNFVRAPFLIEGTLEGLIGALLASGVIGLLYSFFNNYLQGLTGYQIIVSYRYYLGLLVLGSLIGLIGSMRAIRRFLE
ncbi:MAG TPA: permease-like cell division protein FtsX, partial [Candidatus Marinimicrobia bacterium]|nr:permease-like cell division protein FtsX [Candidatus Neomarinimicrobiota bacterium]